MTQRALTTPFYFKWHGKINMNFPKIYKFCQNNPKLLEWVSVPSWVMLVSETLSNLEVSSPFHVSASIPTMYRDTIIGAVSEGLTMRLASFPVGYLDGTVLHEVVAALPIAWRVERARNPACSKYVSRALTTKPTSRHVNLLHRKNNTLKRRE